MLLCSALKMGATAKEAWFALWDTASASMFKITCIQTSILTSISEVVICLRATRSEI